MKFDWEKFKKEKIVVHCKTEGEANSFCRMMHEQGMKWMHGASYLTITQWRNCQEETCYEYEEGGLFADYEFYLGEGYAIIEFSDIAKSEIHEITLREFVERREKILDKFGRTDNICVGVDCDDCPFGKNRCIGCCATSENIDSQIRFLEEVEAELLEKESEAKEVKVEELTLEQVCELLGREIKIAE